MATHIDDEEQLEQLKAWWKENWVALVAGLGLGFGAIGGYEGYQSWRNARLEAASQTYEDLKKAVEAHKSDEAIALGGKLVADYASTPYAASASLRLAQVSMELNQPEAAAKHLSWVVEHSDDKGLVQIAKLRKARVLYSLGQHDEALKLLDVESGPYLSLAQELRGDVLLAKGDKAAARAAFEKALSAAGEGAGNRELLQMKFDDLTPAVQS